MSVLAIAVTTLLAGCVGGPVAHEPDYNEQDPVLAGQSLDYAVVPEAFVTARTPENNVDSPALWVGDAGALLLATGKSTGRLMLYDGTTGQNIDTPALAANADGFSRPNGIFVHDDLVFVVERDAARVSVLQLPGLVPVGRFGAEQLRKPYGIWLRAREPGRYEVLVTDAYMDGVDADGEEIVPPLAQLDERVKRYLVTVDDSGLQARHLGSFGDVTVAGAIRVPESIWGDPAHDRLFIAEEDVATGTALRVYGVEGEYRGRTLGLGRFKAQAEGIASWTCADGSGYWITTDQFEDRSLFHVFDRESLQHLGAFAGEITGNTDGVWLHEGVIGNFPHGVFYAVHDDMAVAAFDWADIAGALELRKTCR